jgi:uncharacterized membrane protein
MSRSDWRTVVLVLHIMGAIVALGFSLSYGLWTARGSAEGAAQRVFALRTVSWIDRRFTTPAYVLQAVTGVLLVALIDWDLLRQAWLEVSIGIYVLLTILAIVAFAPAHRRQTAVAERIAAGEDLEAEYASAATAATRWGLVVTLLTVLIVVLMVSKPALWS